MARPVSLAPFSLASSADAKAERAHYYQQVLFELVDIGMDIPHQLQADVEAADKPASSHAPEVAVAYERITRAVRRSILLAHRLDDPAPLAHDPTAHRTAKRAAARRRIIRDVEDAIQRHTPSDDDDAGDDGDDAGSLHAELLDRLDGPDLDHDIDARPVADIIADICRDLGIAGYPGSQPWKRRTPVDVAALCALAAATARPANQAGSGQSPAHPEQPEQFFRLVAPPAPPSDGALPQTAAEDSRPLHTPR